MFLESVHGYSLDLDQPVLVHASKTFDAEVFVHKPLYTGFDWSSCLEFSIGIPTLARESPLLYAYNRLSAHTAR